MTWKPRRKDTARPARRFQGAEYDNLGLYANNLTAYSAAIVYGEPFLANSIVQMLQAKNAMTGVQGTRKQNAQDSARTSIKP